MKPNNVLKEWTNKESLTALRRSDFNGYWLRLKTLGFVFIGTKINYRDEGKFAYIQINWRFYNSETKERVFLMVSRAKYRLVIKKNGKVVCKKNSLSGDFESTFLKHFNQENKPLFIRRMGRQTAVVKAWQARWKQHVLNDGKWSKRIIQLGILPVHMPEALTKPPRKG